MSGEIPALKIDLKTQPKKQNRAGIIGAVTSRRYGLSRFARSALACLEAGVLLVDDVDAALAADHAAGFVPGLHGFQRVDDLHRFKS